MVNRIAKAAGGPFRDAQILARHADPTHHRAPDRARDRHGVHFLTAYVAGV
jgi:integrase/recombinase XerD